MASRERGNRVLVMRKHTHATESIVYSFRLLGPVCHERPLLVSLSIRQPMRKPLTPLLAYCTPKFTSTPAPAPSAKATFQDPFFQPERRQPVAMARGVALSWRRPQRGPSSMSKGFLTCATVAMSPGVSKPMLRIASGKWILQPGGRPSAGMWM